MFIALDKLHHQGIKKIVVAVPEKSIGRSFQNTKLMPHGFFADWTVTPYFNLCDTTIKGNDIVNEKGEVIDVKTIGTGNEQESEGNRMIRIANRFINIDKLFINLIDTINPFQRAYEVLSKSVDASTLKIIQDTIAEQKFNLTIEQAITLFKGPLKTYIAEHNGAEPSLNDPSSQVRELAAALQMIKNLKIRKMKGLEYEPENNQ